MRIEGARAVLFDKDGTLFDFQKSWRGLGVRAIAHFADGDAAMAASLAERGGFDLALERFLPESPLVSATSGEIAAIWSETLGGATSAGVIEEWLNTEAALAAATEMAPATEDLGGVLDRLIADGFALGVATNDAERAARAQLSRTGVLDRFVFVVGYDSGVAPKPDPAMVLAFAAASGAAPAEVVMVGDSLHDIRAARAAGALAAIGVLTGPAPRALLESEADLVIESIEDLPAALGF